MKLSTVNWLSKAIVLPLFMTILNTTSASAERIDRSRSISLGATTVNTLPSVIDLNLMVPATSSILLQEDREQSRSIEPFWSKPSRNNSSTTVIRKVHQSKLKSIKKSESSINASAKVLISEPSSKIKTSRLKPRKMVSTRIDPLKLSIARDVHKSRYNPKKLASVSIPGSRSQLSGTYLRLVRLNKGTNDIGNPIYTLEAYVDGEIYQTFNTISGTVNTQNMDRNVGNNSAPLPDGLYDVSNQILPGIVPEVGKTFISIFPKFETGRSGLGIHLDPSFNQRNGYDGTAGCIGMTTATDRDAINKFVTKYHPHSLVVKIESLEDS
ncbi:hypothetical protein [Chamaesiphon sp.]|uniref:hypothetical protein n=1 Tax=Chamaesiphon sp. TaxID=2814140 RepID=UPI0035941359